MGRARTLRKNSVRYCGVQTFNALPEDIKLFQGSKEGFKKILDEFLGNLPDQPEVDNLVPGARTLEGSPSNAVFDWIRTTNVVK